LFLRQFTEDKVEQLVFNFVQFDCALDYSSSGEKLQPGERPKLRRMCIDGTASVPLKVATGLGGPESCSIHVGVAGVKERHHRFNKHLALPSLVLTSARQEQRQGRNDDGDD
jgi:hypothetical protein